MNGLEAQLLIGWIRCQRLLSASCRRVCMEREIGLVELLILRRDTLRVGKARDRVDQQRSLRVTWQHSPRLSAIVRKFRS